MTIEGVFLRIEPSITISRLAILSIKEVCDYLKINCCFEVSSEFYNETKNIPFKLMYRTPFLYDDEWKFKHRENSVNGPCCI